MMNSYFFSTLLDKSSLLILNDLLPGNRYLTMKLAKLLSCKLKKLTILKRREIY